MSYLAPFRIKCVAILSLVTIISGCKTAQDGEHAYELAQGCYAVQPYDSTDFLVADQDTYKLQASSEQGAEKFFLKPSSLGSFLLYDRAGYYLSANGLKIRRTDVAGAGSAWAINHLEINDDGTKIGDAYTLTSENSLDPRLSASSGKLSSVLVNAKPPLSVAFNLVPQPDSACTSHPEAALDAKILSDAEAQSNPNEPVVGFADLHTHIGFPKSMASLSMVGDVFHAYGIEHALHDCDDIHGNNGSLDFLEGNDGNGGHNTTGYPELTYWPHRSSKTHVQAYYRWLQRAQLSGLKLIVTNVTGNPAFCDLLSLMHLGKTKDKCTGVDAVKQQTQYIYDLQDYVDAQEGGPGKGWFRIVTSPSQARQAIAKNQLAVVLGTEHGALFDCREGVDYCTEEYVEEQLSEIYDMGIRSVFPIHRFDNGFGGTKTADGADGGWMHLTSKMSTSKMRNIIDLLNPARLLFKEIGGHFWEFEDCPAGINGATGVMSMVDFVNNDLSVLTDAVSSVGAVGPLLEKGLDVIFIDKLSPLPDYAEFEGDKHLCNKRGLQDIGAYLINRIIDKGMILEIDHMSYFTQKQTLDILQQRQYSGFISSHDWFENNEEIRSQILGLGGLISPMKGNPSSIAGRIKALKAELEQHPYTVGVAVSTDIQGVTSQANSDDGVEIEYPFLSYDGNVRFYKPKTGNREFDYATEGVAHYGLLAEWVENLRQVDENDPEDLMGIFMNSAEAYLQMWERAEN
ncbi:MAG: hypothetical protein COA99_15305 [Moraxellaceae bacterium]|nr:MAG: hypothetical protein COA99_15305 [Moraxellaceae bacterium]